MGCADRDPASSEPATLLPLAGQDLEPVVGLAGKGAGLGMEGEQESSLWGGGGQSWGGAQGCAPHAFPATLVRDDLERR